MIPSSGPFYRTPLTASFGFGKHAVGVNTLSKYMQAMFSGADIDSTNRKIVNHSGRVSCCTGLYNSGFDDKACRARVIVVMLFIVISGLLSNKKCLSVKR